MNDTQKQYDSTPVLWWMIQKAEMLKRGYCFCDECVEFYGELKAKHV